MTCYKHTTSSGTATCSQSTTASPHTHRAAQSSRSRGSMHIRGLNGTEAVAGRAGAPQAGHVVLLCPLLPLWSKRMMRLPCERTFSCSFPPPLQRLQLPRGARQGGKNEQKMGVFAHSLRGFERSVASGPGQFGHGGHDGGGLHAAFPREEVVIGARKLRVANRKRFWGEGWVSDNPHLPKPTMGRAAAAGTLLNE